MTCTYVIAVEQDSEIVGHLPRTISTPYHLFLQRGGSITCIITGPRQFSNDLPQERLEVPCTLNFEGALNNIEKIKKLLNEVTSQPDVKESTGNSKNGNESKEGNVASDAEEIKGD